MTRGERIFRPPRRIASRAFHGASKRAQERGPYQRPPQGRDDEPDQPGRGPRAPRCARARRSAARRRAPLRDDRSRCFAFVHASWLTMGRHPGSGATPSVACRRLTASACVAVREAAPRTGRRRARSTALTWRSATSELRWTRTKSGAELVRERPQRLVDQVSAARGGHRHVLLVRGEVIDVLDRDQTQVLAESARRSGPAPALEPRPARDPERARLGETRAAWRIAVGQLSLTHGLQQVSRLPAVL